MSNALSIFDTPRLQVPAHAANFFGDNSNIADRVTVPSLGFEGKVWSVSLNGEKTKLMKVDKDTGDETPLGVMRVVVLDYNKRRGRAYYEGTYDPAKAGAPVCWSDDGITPDATVKEPVHSKCEGCPMSIKGSRTNDNGKAVVACSQHRMLAVVPAAKLDSEPLRMKIAVTSDWDKNSPELEAQGWFAFNNYTDMLRSKGVQHTAALVTKMKFDPGVAYPKIVFSPDRWLEAAELAQVAPLTQSEKVKGLISGTWTPAGVDGVEKSKAADPVMSQRAVDDDDDDGAAAAAAQKKASEALIAQAAAEAEAKKAAAAAKKKAAAEAKAQAEAPKATTVVMTDDDDDDTAVVVEHKAAAPEAAAPVPDAVASLLSEWGDDD